MHPFLHTVLAISVVLGATMGACAYLIWLERKLAAWVQDRVGPNRVGKFGLLQPLADGLKFLLKEDIVPAHVDKALYFLAPSISIFTTFLAFSAVPFGPSSGQSGEFQFVIAPQLDIGILFLFAAGSLAVYGIILGGWASNNKYSMLGALRSSAQVISYEIPLGLSLMGVILLTGSLNLEQVINHQTARGVLGWHVWYQPLACLIFFMSALAESNRLPFDLPECEQELVGGYHTEYSAMKFAMFFLAEYTHVITVSFLVAILFFGGWQFPWIAEADSVYPGATVVKVLVLLVKVFAFILFIMLIRWTIPRYRYDQLMSLVWYGLIPLTVLNLVCVMFVKQFGLPEVWLLPASGAMFVGATIVSAQAAKRRVSRGLRRSAAVQGGG
ncbi:MAG: NADH-quinone oxidoreductase subunit NuoH [Candidatus Anammoximicrobium sp.]|nr:NADH-quinone oxidoreductase subunit NuoH [Candidatus Anammoximicrobium sp.]